MGYNYMVVSCMGSMAMGNIEQYVWAIYYRGGGRDLGKKVSYEASSSHATPVNRERRANENLAEKHVLVYPGLFGGSKKNY